MFARVYGPATIDQYLADPCGFVLDTQRLIAEGVVYIHGVDNEFMGPGNFIPGPGPGVRTVNAYWMGRLDDLVNGGVTTLAFHLQLVITDDGGFIFRSHGPKLAPDPLMEKGK